MRKLLSLFLVATLPCFMFTSCNTVDDDNGVKDPTEKEDNGNEEGKEEENPTPEDLVFEGYQAVDLGLSVYWAEYNVGAEKAEDYGDYYAWAETETKEEYTDDNYTVVNAEGKLICPTNISGTEFDVARVKWGGEWRIPTPAECQELINKCTWVREDLNGVNGYTVTGPNDNKIFLPAAGYIDKKPRYTGSNGSYWASNANVGEPGGPWAWYIVMGSQYRYDWSWASGGQSVRPVISKKK